MKAYALLLKHSLYLLTALSMLACQQSNQSDTSAEKKTSLSKDTLKINQDTTRHQPDTLIVSDPKLASLIKETEDLFERYDTIRQSETYAISQLRLSKKLRNQFTSLEKDSIDGFEIYGVLQDLIGKNIQKILTYKDIEQYDPSLLLRNCLYAVKSPDGKLYSFSFDENTGGSYKSRISYIYYLRDKGSPLLLSTTSDDTESEVFNRDGYGSIDTLQTKEGVKYLLIGAVVGCTTCIGNYVDLVHYKKGKFIREFNYQVDTRMGQSVDSQFDGETISYNNKKRKIDISYYTDDLTPNCNCDTYGSVSSYNEAYANVKTKQVDCSYTFDGKRFKLSKKKVTPIKTKP